jgi:hypothetical protein
MSLCELMEQTRCEEKDWSANWDVGLGEWVEKYLHL